MILLQFIEMTTKNMQVSGAWFIMLLLPFFKVEMKVMTLLENLQSALAS